MSLQDDVKLLPIDDSEKVKPQLLEYVETILKSFDRIQVNENDSKAENQLPETSTRKLALVVLIGLILFLILNLTLFKMRCFENDKALSLGLNVLLATIISVTIILFFSSQNV